MAKSAKSNPAPPKADLGGKTKSDFPKHSLESAIKVASAIFEHNGGRPLPPTDTAIALGVSPGSSAFRILLSSSIKYGLTSGSYNQERVSLEHAGQNIVEPKSPADKRQSLIKAALTPPSFKSIFDYFKGKKLPEQTFFENTVVREFGIPRDQAKTCISVFCANMEFAGLVKNANTGKWLSSDPLHSLPPSDDPDDKPDVDPPLLDVSEPVVKSTQIENGSSKPASSNARLSRVFITHGRNKAFINPIKDLLSFGSLEPVVSVERESVAQPVPEKVMNDMRSCGSAIIHVEDELRLMDSSAKEHVVLNQNVLIEIGAAMALYGRRFILLVKDGVKLPSNLQGLYEVRYDGEKLDGEVTIKLLRAINEIKNHALPVE